MKVPDTRRIHALLLTMGDGTLSAAEMDAQIRLVRLSIGGRNLIELTVPQIVAILAYRGFPFVNGFLPLYFSKPEARTPVGEEATALTGYNVGADIILEIVYRSNAEYNAIKGVNTGFVPAVAGLVEYDYVNDPNRAFVTQLPVSIQNAGAGDTDFNTLPRTGAYKAVHLFTNLVSRVQVYRQGIKIADRNALQVAQVGARNGLTPQAGHFPVDFAFTDQASDALDMGVPDGKGGSVPVTDFNLKFTTTGGGTIPAIVEQVVKI